VSGKGWPEVAVERAKKLIAEEPELLEKAFCPEFAEYAKRTGLFFSFGDISWLINTSLNNNIRARFFGSGAGIACFETLIMRFKLYLIQELKAVLSCERPYSKDGDRIDYNFVSDFLDLFKVLDRLEEMLKEIHEKEGGNYG